MNEAVVLRTVAICLCMRSGDHLQEETKIKTLRRHKFTLSMLYPNSTKDNSRIKEHKRQFSGYIFVAVPKTCIWYLDHLHKETQ